MLEIRNLKVGYGAITALHDVSLSVPAGAMVTLIGSNGAGKSSTLRTVSGLVKPLAGEIIYDGKNIAGLAAHEIVKRGISHVPEGRMVFANLTVHENLMMGAYLQFDKKVIAEELDIVFATFPRLKERDRQIAGTLSGGEQQMLAVSRALMGKPTLLMLDEPSMGLAPVLVDMIFETISAISSLVTSSLSMAPELCSSRSLSSATASSASSCCRKTRRDSLASALRGKARPSHPDPRRALPLMRLARPPTNWFFHPRISISFGPVADETNVQKWASPFEVNYAKSAAVGHHRSGTFFFDTLLEWANEI